MLSIIEEMVVKAGYTYRRMDGSTRIATRGKIIDEFNQKANVFLFLLTTKVAIEYNFKEYRRCLKKFGFFHC